MPAAAGGDAPEYLTEGARAEWNRLAPELLKIGLLTVADITTFAGYCTAFDRWQTAERNIHESTMVLETATGYPMINPWVTISKQQQLQMIKFASELGISATARARLAKDPKQDPASEEEQLKLIMGGRR
jgi:P27 family predicted phage terminase small subunit